MKFDAIVTEPSHKARKAVWPVALPLACVFSLAVYLAGDGSAGETILSKPAEPSEVRLVTPANKTETRSLLADITPISNAAAAVAPPVSALPTESTIEETDSLPEEGIAAAPAAIPTEQNLNRLRDKTIKVRSGDSLSTLFNRNGLKAADWMQLAKLKGDAKRLLKLRPGDKLMLGLDADGHVAALDMRTDEFSTLKIRRNEQGEFEQSVSQDKLEFVQRHAQGRIENSLFLSAKAAGLSDALTMELTDIYAWDIDFALDIRSGDQFEVVYEEIHRDGKKVKDGKILAARFTNKGKGFEAVRYIDEQGRTAYYAPDGKPMKKAFLRSPVDFTRISSRFSLGRKHPILNKIRAHKGVDYAAPRGTPVKSAGAGKVVFAGNKGGYGRVVIVQHAGKYKTLYAHLNSFRRGIRRGTSVTQGQTIGYVGSSGLATGPHLHYEFQVGGRHVDPLKVKLPSAPAIAKSELARFQEQTQELLAKLSTSQTTEVAAAN